MFSLWGTTAGNLIMTFLISMVPVLELRAAIPLGVINGLDIWAALIVAIIGNLVPVPFIIIFIRITHYLLPHLIRYHFRKFP